MHLLQTLNLIQELDLSLTILKTGLGYLQRDNSGMRSHFVFMLLLSSGLERLLKVLYVVKFQEVQGCTPERGALRNFGHRIEMLLDEYLMLVEPGMKKVPAVVIDLEFMHRDPLLRSILTTLTLFGKESRYSFLDKVVDPSDESDYFKDLWQLVDDAACPDFDPAAFLLIDGYPRFVEQATKRIVICFERLFRALSRTIVFSISSTDSRSLASQFISFVNHDDRDFGTVLYPLFRE